MLDRKLEWHGSLFKFNLLLPSVIDSVDPVALQKFSMDMRAKGVPNRFNKHTQREIDIVTALLAKYFPGTDFQAKYSEFFTTMATIPHPDDIMRDPLKAIVPANPLYQSMVAATLAKRMVEQYGEDGVAQAQTYLGRLDPKLAGEAADTMVTRKPTLASPTMTKLISDGRKAVTAKSS